jgi:hypothetical protein
LGYNFFGKHVEEWNGIKVHRVPVLNRGKGGGIRLFFNYFSFAFFASFRVLWMEKNYEKVFVYEPSPITVGIPAIILSKLYHIPFLFWVQDLWPASITAAAGIKNRFVIDFFDWITRVVYHSSSTILVQSKAFIPYIILCLNPNLFNFFLIIFSRLEPLTVKTNIGIFFFRFKIKYLFYLLT